MADPYQAYLSQAAALFEAGEVVKAGQIWQAILKREPGHEEARAGLYKVKVYFDSRATQDGLKVEPEPAPVPDRETHIPQSAETNSLLDAGCALYDAGLLEKAIATWELILQKDPGNALARGYIDGARRKQEAERPQPPPPPEPPAPAVQAPPPEEDAADKLLRDGTTLFDMGQAEDALRKWEEVLALDPGHFLARTYANDARRELGLPPLAEGEVGAPPPPRAVAPEPSSPAADGRAEQLVREGVQIYDMGMIEEAQEKWNEALALDPTHVNAAGYLEMARRDRANAAPLRPLRPAPRAEVPPPGEPSPDPLEARILNASNLLRNKKLDEAAFAFQQLLESGSRDPRILQGYQHARALLCAREEEAAPAPLPPSLPAAPPPQPVGPPKAVTTRPAVRAGLTRPRFLGSLNVPDWLESPRNLAILGGGVLLAGAGLMFFRSYQRDVALREAVSAAKATALEPGARKSQAISLLESPADIRREADNALSEDSLLAFYRAQECLRLDAGDVIAAQLLERARTKLAQAVPLGAESDIDKAIKGGDLDSARTSVEDQLKRNPDDAELKAKARVIYLALVQSHAMQEHFSKARELLLLGRAMFPQDHSWQVRLKLLDEIQGMAKGARATWIPLLG
jgi:tetratricopeptide (TPR) repeat protein